ncbi:hypothetical protein IKT64_02155 [Candidatus Saccharibacteria bacterium]|nr:hypothetical protein [Candidatus Saccharibacteria bacterium]
MAKSYIKQEEKHYPELYIQAMELWKQYSEEYRTICDNYKAKLAEKRRLRIAPIQRIPTYILDEFPNIEFLKLDSQGAAQQYLLRKTDQEVKKLITVIEKTYLGGVAYITLRDRIKHFEDQIDKVKKHGRSYNQYCPNELSRRAMAKLAEKEVS